ncbi:OLC1v1019331C2 [Oldenlandia corymbosa var. corymbosa]|nr:OLC1v1019331C2 [Oldenlandia corymbosa var. corymbosa]
MGRQAAASSHKRKQPEPISAVVGPDRYVLDAIKKAEDKGTWKKAIVSSNKNLTEYVVQKSLNSLLSKRLIKEVMNIQNKRTKLFMAAEFEPSKEVSGGFWYDNGKLDKECIEGLKRACLKFIVSKEVATVEVIYELLKRSKVITSECTKEQIEEILKYMLLDNEIIEVESTGLGEYHLFPVGTLCYRLAKGRKTSAMASNPCGMCPKISQCTPDGRISPATCVYYKKWMDIF